VPTREEKQTAGPKGFTRNLAELRARIEQRRRQSARRQGREGTLVALEETPEQRRRRWREMAAEAARGLETGAYDPMDLLSDLRDNKAMIGLGREFLKAAERGNAPAIQAFIEEGFPVNYRDPQTGETALHAVAACKARKALRVLLASGRCDFLLRDTQGRLASELAYLYGQDPAAARLLGIKERQQAAARGITLTRRPQISP
jgi:hypothetical protein